MHNISDPAAERVLDLPEEIFTLKNNLMMVLCIFLAPFAYE